MTDKISRFLELIGIAPPGTVKAHEVLELAARNLAKGGEMKIFTPMYFQVGLGRGSAG
jgi:sterol 24-C-methyltransferase